MNNSMDFSQPHRLDAGGFIVEGLLSFGRVIRSLALPLVFIAVKNGHLFLTWQFWAILGGLVVVHFIYSYFRHRNFIFYVDEEAQTFVLSSGLLSKSKIVLKFENILQVNVRQNVIQQALDLYSLEIDSAGSKEKEVDLYALSEPTALALRDYLVAKNLSETENREGVAQQEPIADELLFRIPNSAILLVSLFTNYKQGLLLFFTFLIGLIDVFRDFIPTIDYEGYYQDYQAQWMNFIGQLLLVFGLILLIPIGINLVKYFLTYFSFSLRKNQKGDFMMHYGLFHLQQVIFNRKKIQMMSFVQNRILKLMDLGILSLLQVNTDPQQKDQGIIHIPGINTLSREAVWQLVFGRSLADEAVEIKKPKIGLFLSRMVKLTIITLAVAFLWYYRDGDVMGLWAICSLFILLSVYNIIYYGTYRLRIYGDCLVKEDGVWDQKEMVLPLDRIISVSVSQTIWQRMPKTANLHVSTASGEVVFRHFDRQALINLSNQLLYTVERV